MATLTKKNLHNLDLHSLSCHREHEVLVGDLETGVHVRVRQASTIDISDSRTLTWSLYG